MKQIVIAGAGSGAGLETARKLNKKAKLILISRSITPEIEQLEAEYVQHDTVHGNVEDLKLPEKVDGLVYCPGSITLKSFNKLTISDFTDDFTQNVTGAVSLIQQALPSLKKAGTASIVMFSSVAVKLGMPFHASIAAAKGAVEGLARSLAAELAPNRIRVNVIAPSLTDTPLAAGLLNTEAKRKAAAGRHPLRRIGQPSETAGLATFLLDDQSAWITGQVIGIDGGLGNLKL